MISLRKLRQKRRSCQRGSGGFVLAAAVAAILCLGLSTAFAAWSGTAGAAAVDHGQASVKQQLPGEPPALVSFEKGGRSRRSSTARRAFLDGDFLATAQQFVEQLPAYVETLGPSGPFLFYLVFVLIECLSLPASPLMLSSGLLFGLSGGFAISLLSLCSAASISFVLARTVLRPQLLSVAEGNNTFQEINCAVQAEGLKIIFLLRLAPLLPFALSNYAYGLTKVAFQDFFLATATGCAPGTLATVYFATVARSAANAGESAGTPWYVYAGGIAATAFLLKTVTDVAKQAVADSIEADKKECEIDEGSSPSLLMQTALGYFANPKISEMSDVTR